MRFCLPFQHGRRRRRVDMKPRARFIVRMQIRLQGAALQSNLNRACFSHLQKKKPIHAPLPRRGKERWKAQPGSSEFSFYPPGTIYHPFLSLSSLSLSVSYLARKGERERGGAFLSEQRRRKKRGGKRRLAESIFARQCGSLIIYAKLSRSEREREMEDRGSYFLPVTSHYYAGRSRGQKVGKVMEWWS